MASLTLTFKDSPDSDGFFVVVAADFPGFFAGDFFCCVLSLFSDSTFSINSFAVWTVKRGNIFIFRQI